MIGTLEICGAFLLVMLLGTGATLAFWRGMLTLPEGRQPLMRNLAELHPIEWSLLCQPCKRAAAREALRVKVEPAEISPGGLVSGGAWKPHDFGPARPTPPDALCQLCGRAASEVAWSWSRGQPSHCRGSQGAPEPQATGGAERLGKITSNVSVPGTGKGGSNV